MYRTTRIRTFGILTVATLAALLAACGGDGSSSGNTTFTVGGSVTGLASGSSVVLQNNGGNNLTVSANGTFTFTTAIASGGAYAVTVSTQPANATCTVSGGSGTASANITSVVVACAVTTYAIGGTISGLATGKSIVLQDNGADNLTVSANGSFTFATKVASGGAYDVTILTPPAGQTCTVANATGTSSATITPVPTVACTSVYTISANVTGLGAGLSVTLQDNGADNKSVTASGTAQFATAIVTGKPYAVSVLTQPTGQTCAVTSGSGTVASADVTIGVNCTYNSSNASLDGAYTTLFYAINGGASAGNVPLMVTAAETDDGAGNYTDGIGTLNIGGTIYANVNTNNTGTYDVTATGTFLASGVIDGGILGVNGNAYMSADLTAGDQPSMAIGVKAASGLSTASLAGNFTLVAMKYGATGDEGDLAVVTFDTAGNGTGTDSANDLGVITTTSASLNTLTVAANGALTDTQGTIGALSPDTNFFVSGTFSSGQEPKIGLGVRTGSTMTLAQVSGQYTGVDYNGQKAGGFANTSVVVATVILDGKGNFSGSSTANSAGAISAGPGTGTYTVQANGSMTLIGADDGGSYVGAVSVDGNYIVLTVMTSGNAPEILVLFRQ